MFYFSLELSKTLSILCPKFEGHYWYFQAVCGVEVQCLPEAEAEKFEMFGRTKICPAWQVEDVLRNLQKIFKLDDDSVQLLQIMERICFSLYQNPDTAYQKIEEYLWSILK